MAGFRELLTKARQNVREIDPAAAEERLNDATFLDVRELDEYEQGAVPGTAFIPFYFGGDKHRYEMVYKNQGRLIFAGGGMGDFTSGHLIWIIHSATEGGYR